MTLKKEMEKAKKILQFATSNIDYDPEDPSAGDIARFSLENAISELGESAE